MPTEIVGRDVAIVCTIDHPGDKLAALLFAASLARDLGASSVGLLASIGRMCGGICAFIMAGR